MFMVVPSPMGARKISRTVLGTRDLGMVEAVT